MATDSYNYYCIRIPTPALPGELKHIAHVETPRGDVNVYSLNAREQIVMQHGDAWYLQPDNYTLDSIADVLKIQPSMLDVQEESLYATFEDGRKFKPDEVFEYKFPGAYWWWVERHLHFVNVRLHIFEKPAATK